MEKMKEQLEEWEWEENVEKEENRMNMKALNQHPDFYGFCDDWEANTHEGVHHGTCNFCDEEINEGEEFI